MSNKDCPECQGTGTVGPDLGHQVPCEATGNDNDGMDWYCADGKVTLNEAYQHAYNKTLIRSSRVATGAQHASAEFDLEMAGELVLTRTELARSVAAVSVFSTDTTCALVRM